MKKNEPSLRSTERWAHFRFSVIGALLAAPPLRGQLQAQIQALADKPWRHPIGGHHFTVGVSNIERWYQKASAAKAGPVEVLKRKIRSDQGRHRALSATLVTQLTEQYRQHPSWSYQLHADNLAAQIAADPSLGSQPSYASVLRFMKGHGLIKRPRRGPVHSPGGQAAEARFEAREVRSFENPYVNGLWHLDFHHGSRRVLLPSGQWAVPLLLGVLDDHSRLCCHAQWYLAEGAEDLCHGLSQAFQKRGIPRSLLDDNGSAMIAAETEQGLARLSIVAEHTLPFSPYQNGKQEAFWNQIEDTALHRPVLLIDEAQERNGAVFSELRLLSSADLDSRSILTLVMAGDQRLLSRLEEVDLLPIASRVRSRLRLEALTPKQLLECLTHLLNAAGNPRLLTPTLAATLCEHGAGNLRLLMNLANDLLMAATRQEREQLDEKLFFELFTPEPKSKKS